MFNPGNKAPALGGDRNVYGIFILYSKPSEHLHKAIWPMHKSPNLAPQANPQLYKVFCVLQILGCICLSRLERSSFRTEPPIATIFGMPYKKNPVVHWFALELVPYGNIFPYGPLSPTAPWNADWARRAWSADRG